MISSHNGNLGIILPILSVYALAGVKLLPAFQIIYANTARIKANSAAFESIEQDLISSTIFRSAESQTVNKDVIKIEKLISLEDITFTYPNSDKPVLDKLDMSIPVNNVIGIVGPSGSGKSTLIDVLLGLITPQQGRLLIDNTEIDSSSLRAWQNTIGFVSQSIFLSEGTIAENVAFGIPKEKINIKQVYRSLKLANLEKFLDGLDKGLDTMVGERGVQLSGGQRQRIGIARALYYEAKVLVFDEATSSLDGITENDYGSNS